MTKIISIHEAKTHLSEYMRLVAAGEEVQIGAYGQPTVALVPVARAKLKLGIWKHKDNFKLTDELMVSDPELAKAFEDSPVFPDAKT